MRWDSSSRHWARRGDVELQKHEGNLPSLGGEPGVGGTVTPPLRVVWATVLTGEGIIGEVGAVSSPEDRRSGVE